MLLESSFAAHVFWFFNLIFKMLLLFPTPVSRTSGFLSFKKTSFPLSRHLFCCMETDHLENLVTACTSLPLHFNYTLSTWSWTWTFLESGSSWFLWNFLFSRIKIEKHLRKEIWSVWTTLWDQLDYISWIKCVKVFKCLWTLNIFV